MGERWRRRRDRKAATRLLERLHTDHGQFKSGNDRLVEAWLWHVWGDDDMAVAILTAEDVGPAPWS